MIFLNSYTKSPKNSGLQNTLLHKFFQTVIFFDQFKMPTIKFGKSFVEFMIPISLLKKFGSLKFVKINEVSNKRRCSVKANKLRYIYTISGTSRDIAIKERKINNIKFKIIPCIIYFCRNYIIMNR